MRNYELNWKKIWEKKKNNFTNYNLNQLLDINGHTDFALVNEKNYIIFIRKLAKLLNIRKNSYVFEFGCGAGLNLFLLKKYCDNLYGYDYSKSLIKIAQKVLNNKEKINYKKNLFNKKNFFDSSFINSVLQYNSKKNIEVILNFLVSITKNYIFIGDVYDKKYWNKSILERKKFLTTKEYKKRYRGIRHTFINKIFFRRYANKNNIKVTFLKNLIKRKNKVYRYSVIFKL